MGGDDAALERSGAADREFLERVFQKLLVNFTWWLNRQDADGNNVFSGGFLGLDNISPIDRSNLPPGVSLEQADGTAWMAIFSLNMLEISIELAMNDSPPDFAVCRHSSPTMSQESVWKVWRSCVW